MSQRVRRSERKQRQREHAQVRASMGDWAIRDKDGYLVYSAPGAGPIRFETQQAAEQCMRKHNWHLDEMLVGKVVDGEFAVAEGTHTPLEA